MFAALLISLVGVNDCVESQLAHLETAPLSPLIERVLKSPWRPWAEALGVRHYRKNLAGVSEARAYVSLFSARGDWGGWLYTSQPSEPLIQSTLGLLGHLGFQTTTSDVSGFTKHKRRGRSVYLSTPGPSIGVAPKPKRLLQNDRCFISPWGSVKGDLAGRVALTKVLGHLARGERGEERARWITRLGLQRLKSLTFVAGLADRDVITGRWDLQTVGPNEGILNIFGPAIDGQKPAVAKSGMSFATLSVVPSAVLALLLRILGKDPFQYALIDAHLAGWGKQKRLNVSRDVFGDTPQLWSVVSDAETGRLLLSGRVADGRGLSELVAGMATILRDLGVSAEVSKERSADGLRVQVGRSALMLLRPDGAFAWSNSEQLLGQWQSNPGFRKFPGRGLVVGEFADWVQTEFALDSRSTSFPVAMVRRSITNKVVRRRALLDASGTTRFWVESAERGFSARTETTSGRR